MSTTKLSQNQLNDYSFASGLARNSIINGNFDVWQRGTSFTLANNAGINFTADRWRGYYDFPAGSPQTTVKSRGILASGDIPGAYYYLNTNYNGAGSSLGNSYQDIIGQKIENGTRYLCGLGKKVTYSFWAKSDIASRKIGIFLTQNYGTGGSPSTSEVIVGGVITLTSSWTKYTWTFTTNTLVGKTFGTANDDFISPQIFFSWGTDFSARMGVTYENLPASGNISIAQVQLCAGDVALPFMPKSEAQEKQDCMRYYYVAGNSETNYDSIANGMCTSTTGGLVNIFYPVPMRIAPTVTYPTTNTLSIIKADGSTVACSSLSDNIISRFSARITFAVASGLTAGNAAILFSTSSPSKIIFSSEL